MKILVIGGTRFFGKRLVSLLLERGDEVTILTRGKTPDPFGGRVERIVGDRRDLARTGVGERRWDVVYDQVCYEASEARQACEVFRARVKHYVFTSSQSVYGPGAELPESAFDPLAHSWSSDADREKDYGEAKRQCEAVFFQSGAFPVTAVRFPIVLGPDDYTERLKFHVERIRDGKPVYFPNFDARIGFVEAGDAAEFLSWVGPRGAAGPINVSSPEPIVLRDLVSLIEQAVGRRANLVSRAEEGEESPFGAESDWTRDTSKLQKLGFRAKPLRAWLLPLIRELAGTGTRL